MAAPQNSKGRQRSVWIPIDIDDWLLERVRDRRAISEVTAKLGVATEVKDILRKAYENRAKSV